MVVDHKPPIPRYNLQSRLSPVRVDRHKSKLLAFDSNMLYEPGLKNACDYASRHLDPLPRFAVGSNGKLTDSEKNDLGVEEKIADSSIQVNGVVMENEGVALTREDIEEHTHKDKNILQILQHLKDNKLSQQAKSTPYGKVFNQLSVYSKVRG